jgi:hypothetical protein
MEGDGRLTRDIHSPPPGDVRRLGRKASGPELSKKRSQYFEDAFRSKHPAEERKRLSSLLSTISADVKTNVFVRITGPFRKTILTPLPDSRRVQFYH